MNTLFKSAKILGFGALLIHGASAHARIQTLEVSCVQAGIPSGRITNRVSAGGQLRIHRQGSTRGTLTISKSGSSRPQSVELEVEGLTMNDGIEGIRNLDAPTIVQLITSESDKNREALKTLGVHSVSLMAISGNALGEIDIEAEGQSSLASATKEQVSENDATEVPMSCILELK